MATKAELETELAELRRQLAERPQSASTSEPEQDEDGVEKADADIADGFEKLDIEKEI